MNQGTVKATSDEVMIDDGSDKEHVHTLSVISNDASDMASWPLSRCVEEALDRYFEDLDGTSADSIHAMVMEQVERPMYKIVMERVGHNQTRAAKVLGINRGTLRKKLAHYGLD